MLDPKRIALLFTLTVGPLGCTKSAPPATPNAAATPAGEVALLPDKGQAPSAGAGQASDTALPAGHPPVGNAAPAPTGLPSGHPPIGGQAGAVQAGGPMMAQLEAEKDVPMPLPLEGAGSVAELKARLAKVKDATKHAAFDEAFRKVFTVQRPARDNKRAGELMTPLATDSDPLVAALAERILGYVRVNSGFDAAGAQARYEKAVALDPDYGEAHYALAFVLAISDLGRGKTHFEKAMSLGVPDTRGLRGQFYKD
jgi:hypothetical protein